MAIRPRLFQQNQLSCLNQPTYIQPNEVYPARECGTIKSNFVMPGRHLLIQQCLHLPSGQVIHIQTCSRSLRQIKREHRRRIEWIRIGRQRKLLRQLGPSVRIRENRLTKPVDAQLAAVTNDEAAIVVAVSTHDFDLIKSRIESGCLSPKLEVSRISNMQNCKLRFSDEQLFPYKILRSISQQSGPVCRCVSPYSRVRCIGPRLQ